MRSKGLIGALPGSHAIDWPPPIPCAATLLLLLPLLLLSRLDQSGLASLARTPATGDALHACQYPPRSRICIFITDKRTAGSQCQCAAFRDPRPRVPQLITSRKRIVITVISYQHAVAQVQARLSKRTLLNCGAPNHLDSLLLIKNVITAPRRQSIKLNRV